MRIHEATKCLLLVIVACVVTVHIQFFALFYTNDGGYDDDDEADTRGCKTNFAVSFHKNMTSHEILAHWRNLPGSTGRLLSLGRSSKNYMAMGIVVSRTDTDSLVSLEYTLTLLANYTSTSEKLHNIALIIILNEVNEADVENIIELIATGFLYEIQIGFFQVVQEHTVHLRTSYKLLPPSVHAMLLVSHYVVSIAENYLHIGGTNIDVVPDYIDGVRDFVQRETKRRRRATGWTVLEFGAGGTDFVGQFMHSVDVARYATYFAHFGTTNSTGFLHKTFLDIVSQRQQASRRPSLLRRRGGTEESEDDELKKPWPAADDPPASVVTSMTTVGRHVAELVYACGGGYFQASSPIAGDWIAIIFEAEIAIDHIQVQTGLKLGQSKLVRGSLEASPRLLKLDMKTPSVVCADFIHIGDVQGATSEFYHVQRTLWGRPTRCLRLTVTSADGSDVIFHQIAVFVE